MLPGPLPSPATESLLLLCSREDIRARRLGLTNIETVGSTKGENVKNIETSKLFFIKAQQVLGIPEKIILTMLLPS